MNSSASITIQFRQVQWATCAKQSLELENIIVKEKFHQNGSEKVYGTNPKWMSNMQLFGEMAILTRHSDKRIRN
jgi:hypothetical protein